MSTWTLRNEESLVRLAKFHPTLAMVISAWVGYVIARQERIEQEAHA